MTRHATLCKYGEKPKEEPIRFELLLCFTRHLIRNSVSRDMLVLALMHARDEMGCSYEDVEKLKSAVLREHDANGIWPKGF